MKISTKGRYGLRAMTDLASHMEGAPVSLASVAKRQNLSLNYLEQVFGTLRKAGIVKSLKGPQGGYLLAKEASEITVQEILEALEGKFSIVDAGNDLSQMDAVERAIQELVWNQIDEKVNTFLSECTLEQLANEYRERKSGEEMMYYI